MTIDDDINEGDNDQVSYLRKFPSNIINGDMTQSWLFLQCSEIGKEARK
jgi:hypothetical protein